MVNSSSDQSQEPAEKKKFEDPLISDPVDVIAGNPAMGGLVAVAGSGGSLDGGPAPPDGIALD